MTAVPKLTADDYLALEAASDTKNEFVNGEIIAMAGAGLGHNVVKDAVVQALRNALAPRGRLTMSSDMRVNVSETGLYTYPDVVIICGKPILIGEEPKSLVNPDALVEVLSPSTETWDRGDKFLHYQHCVSLKTYLIVDPGLRSLECYTRESDGSWRLDNAGAEGKLRLRALDVTLDAAEVFAPLDLLPEDELPVRPRAPIFK